MSDSEPQRSPTTGEINDNTSFSKEQKTEDKTVSNQSECDSIPSTKEQSVALQ